MMLACAALLCGMQDPHLAAVLANESRRTATVERCSAAVCSVMSMDSPGGGSGVVFDPAGFVLTNFHVVGEPDKDYKLPKPPEPPEGELSAWRASHDSADKAAEAQFVKEWQVAWSEDHLPRGAAHYKNKKVGLPDGQLYEGEVLGIDPGSDLAVLRLIPKTPGQTWPAADFGNSDQLLVGETVFAMGNPFLLATDFTPTVTFGIVSGTHRYQEGQGQRMLVYPDCIQVDAAVNPGNSGGPLFNEAGEIVGINGRISIGDRGRVNVGVGFAISSNQIKNFLGDLLAGRHAEHGTLDMSAWFMNSGAGAARRRGVFVQQLFRDSIVAAAGVGLGDELLTFNGIEVRSANQLATLVGVMPAGTYVSLSYRPKLDNETWGDERLVHVELTKLDTGSSRDGTGADARLANRNNRRLAAQAIVQRWSVLGTPGMASEWVVTDPSGVATRSICDGKRLRLEIGALVLVCQSKDDGFAIENGAARELSVEERARLERELLCNPLLWPSGNWRDRFANAELLGGVNVYGVPAYRFAIPGDGECEAWVRADGTPAGCTFRDPIRRAKVSWFVGEKSLRLVVDDKVEMGWSAAALRQGLVDEAWFRRP
jgi:S1-C subfamily serine protease